MHLRLNGSKIRSASPDESVFPQSPDHTTGKPAVLSRRAASRTAGFVYVVSSGDGLVQIGSCRDPFSRLAQMRHAHGSRLSFYYLGFIHADRACEVERAAQMALAGPREPSAWLGCPPKVAVAATQGAARRLGVEMIAMNVEGLEDDFRSASLVSATRAGLRRAQLAYRFAIAIGVILGLLALVSVKMSNGLDLHMVMGPGVIGAMIAAFMLGRQRSSAERL